MPGDAFASLRPPGTAEGVGGRSPKADRLHGHHIGSADATQRVCRREAETNQGRTDLPLAEETTASAHFAASRGDPARRKKAGGHREWPDASHPDAARTPSLVLPNLFDLKLAELKALIVLGRIAELNEVFGSEADPIHP